jgi:hypothetical protein
MWVFLGGFFIANPALSTVPEGRHVGQKHEDYDDKTEELVGDVRVGLVHTHMDTNSIVQSNYTEEKGGGVFLGTGRRCPHGPNTHT